MTTDGNAQAAADIRREIDGWTKAFRTKDIDGVMSHYVPDMLAFDLAPPLQHRGQEIRRGLAEWFPTWKGNIGFEMHELEVTAGEDVGFSHSVNHMTGTRTSGETADIWVRATVCFRKTGGRWLVEHEHVSVPFYMDGSYRAAVDLKP